MKSCRINICIATPRTIHSIKVVITQWKRKLLSIHFDLIQLGFGQKRFLQNADGLHPSSQSTFHCSNRGIFNVYLKCSENWISLTFTASDCNRLSFLYLLYAANLCLIVKHFFCPYFFEFSINLFKFKFLKKYCNFVFNLQLSVVCHQQFYIMMYCITCIAYKLSTSDDQ